MSEKELEWFISAELPVVFNELLQAFDSFGPLLCALDQTPLTSQNGDVQGETIPLSSTLKDDHVKGHIKIKGALITKTELSIEINNTPVPIKTVASIKEEEHNPWRLSQLGHAANYLYFVKQRCINISKGMISNLDQAQQELSQMLEEIKRCKLQFVLPKQETSSTFSRNYCVFCPELPAGLLVNFHIKDIKLVLTISCLKSPQDLHVKDKYSLPKSAYVDRTIMLNVHWMLDIYDRLTHLQSEIQMIYQKLSVFTEPREHSLCCSNTAVVS